MADLAPVQLVLDWVDRGIDRDRLPSEVQRQVRLVHFATLALCLFGGPFVLRYWRLGVPVLAIGVAVTVAAALGNLVLLRRTLRPTLCAHLALGLYTGLLLLVVGATGGFYDPSFAWLYTVPVAAAAALGMRGAWIWVGVDVVAATGFWLLPELGIVLHPAIPVAQRPLQALVNRVTGIVALGLLASAFVLGQRRTERDLEEANGSLSRERRYVELLRDVADAANEASSLEEVLQECLERICRGLGWTAGHVYRLNEAGELVHAGIGYSTQLSREGAALLGRMARRGRFRPGEGVPGRALATGRPVAVFDLASEGSSDAALATQAGLGAGFAVPVLAEGCVQAVLELGAPKPLAPDEHLMDLLAHIGIQLGRVATRVALEERLRQSQKLEAVGQLAAGLAHEINNPMAYVKSNLNLLREEWNRMRKGLGGSRAHGRLREGLSDCEDLIDESLEGVERTIQIVRDVRDFSRATGSDRETADLTEILEGAWRVSAPRARQGIQVERSFAPVPPLRCSPGQLRQVFVNLIVNAIQAVGEDGRIHLETAVQGGYAVARIEDDGPGISDADRTRLFDPFFTTKPVGEGTGLGLYVSYQIVTAHGGSILVDSVPGSGSRFEVYLPLADRSQNLAPVVAGPSQPSTAPEPSSIFRLAKRE